MKYSESLKKNKDFQKVYSEKKSYANKYLVMYTMKNNTDQNRVGISVSKKVGNSIIRHRVTRVIREIMRLHWEDVHQGYDIVIVARKSARESEYKKFESAILHLLKQHHLLEEISHENNFN